MTNYIFEKPQMLQLEVPAHFNLGIDQKKPFIPDNVTLLLQGDAPIIVLRSSKDFVDLKFTNPLLGKVPFWHRDHMPLWATYKPKGLKRNYVTQFLLSDYSGFGYHDHPENEFPNGGSSVLSIEYPTEYAQMVIWLNCPLANDRFLFHRTGNTSGKSEEGDCLRILPNLVQPLWAKNGCRADIGWVG